MCQYVNDFLTQREQIQGEHEYLHVVHVCMG